MGEHLHTAARWANKGNANPDLILASKAELARALKVSVSLFCDENEIVRSQLPRG